MRAPPRNRPVIPRLVARPDHTSGKPARPALCAATIDPEARPQRSAGVRSGTDANSPQRP